MPEKDAEDALIKELQALLSDGEEEALQIFLRLARSEDIAEWLDVLPVENRQRIIGVLDADAACMRMSGSVGARAKARSKQIIMSNVNY